MWLRHQLSSGSPCLPRFCSLKAALLCRGGSHKLRPAAPVSADPLCVWRAGGLYSPIQMSKQVLRLVAALLLLTALAVWVATGANRGWTRTSVPVQRTDEVTGITVDDYQKRFVPGVDLLGVALLGSGILAGASFLFRKSQTPVTPYTTKQLRNL